MPPPDDHQVRTWAVLLWVFRFFRFVWASWIPPKTCNSGRLHNLRRSSWVPEMEEPQWSNARSNNEWQCGAPTHSCLCWCSVASALHIKRLACVGWSSSSPQDSFTRSPSTAPSRAQGAAQPWEREHAVGVYCGTENPFYTEEFHSNTQCFNRIIHIRDRAGKHTRLSKTICSLSFPFPPEKLHAYSFDSDVWVHKYNP